MQIHPVLKYLLCMTLVFALLISNIFSDKVYAQEGQTSLLDPSGTGSPEIKGEAYVLYDVLSDTFLLGKNPDTPLPPASITKVMTILLTFEKLKMTDSITVTRDMYESIPEGYEKLGLVEGEKLSVEEAVYACLLISSNDACMALAITMGGTVEGFSKMMNERAAKLGCLHTSFTNPYGLSEENHLSSAHDIALIMAQALKNEEYTKISTTANYTMPSTNKHKPRNITNGNRFISTTTYSYENYIGGKTGYTDASGHTIVAGARQNSRTLIGVILNADNSEVRYANLISLFNYGFENYSTTSIDPADYAESKTQTVDMVSAGIAKEGYNLEITDVSLEIDQYCTTSAANASSGYTSGIDISGAVIQANLPEQTLILPLYRRYADASSSGVGTLKITISDPKSSHTSAPSSKNETQPKNGLLTVIIRASVIIVLLIILAFCIILFVLLQKEKKRHRSRRKPKIL